MQYIIEETQTAIMGCANVTKDVMVSLNESLVFFEKGSMKTEIQSNLLVNGVSVVGHA